MPMPGRQLKHTCILISWLLLALSLTPLTAAAQQGADSNEADGAQAAGQAGDQSSGQSSGRQADTPGAGADTGQAGGGTNSVDIAVGKVLHVRDKIYIPFRSGPSNEYRIIRFLPTGAQLEIKRPNQETIEQFGAGILEDWAYGTHGDQEGWVERQYMVEDEPARMRIGDVEAELESTRDEVAALEQELAQTEDEKEELAAELSDARQRITELEADLEAASDGFRLVQANKKLRERIQIMIDRIEQLQQRNQELAEQTKRDWFLAGSGVLFGGLILGLVLPHLRPRRKTWGSSL